MFRKLKSFFKRKKKKDVISAITIYTDKSGEVFVDLQVQDFSDISIDHLTTLLTMYNPVAFVEVNNIIKYQCKMNAEDGFYEKVVNRFVEKVGTSYFLTEEQKKEGAPFIKPDEMM